MEQNLQFYNAQGIYKQLSIYANFEKHDKLVEILQRQIINELTNNNCQ